MHKGAFGSKSYRKSGEQRTDRQRGSGGGEEKTVGRTGSAEEGQNPREQDRGSGRAGAVGQACCGSSFPPPRRLHSQELPRPL